MGFKKSQNIGSKAELFFIETLEKYHFATTSSFGKNEFWDVQIEFNGKLLLFEVKFDVMSSKTNNLAIEYFNPKSQKLSGVSVTKCDFWVFVLGSPMEIWISDLTKFKEYIGKNPPFRVVDVAGDNNASLYLYKKDKLLSSVFHRIDNIEPAVLQTILSSRES